MQRIKGGWWLGLGWVLVLGGFAAGAHAQDLENGLIARYAFERNLRDLTLNDHDGVAMAGAVPAYVSGFAGFAASFDGSNDAVRFSTLPNSVFNGDFSVSWFMRLPSHGRYSILGNRTTCGSGQYFDIGFDTAEPQRATFVLRAETPIAMVRSATVTLDRWVHLVAVRDAGTIRMYTDGVASAPVTAPSPNFASNPTPLGISTSPCIAQGDGTRFLNGSMDELRVYNRALSAAEALALAQGDGITRSGSVSVTPTTIGEGGRFVVSASGVSNLGGVTCQVRAGFDGAILGSATPNGDGNVQAEILAAESGQRVISLECGSPVRAPIRIGHDTLTVLDPVQIVAAGSGYPGQQIEFTANNIVGNSYELWIGDRRVFGPAPVVDGSTVGQPGGVGAGTFAVPIVSPLAPPNASLVLRGFSGRVQTSSGQLAFARIADPGYRVRIDTATVPAISPPETALTVSGRIQVASGSPQSRTINVFYRGGDGRVIPLGTRDVVPDAQGNFSSQVEIPSAANQNGYIARGAGEIFFTFTEIDPITQIVRTYTQAAGDTGSPGYASFGEGARVVVTVRGNDGQPLDEAYVVVGSGDSDVFSDPNPGEGSSTAATVGPGNQLSFGLREPVQGYQACPLSLASGYTDANGRFEFEIDPNAVRQQVLFRQDICETGGGTYCTFDLAWDTRIKVYSAHLGYGVVENGVVVPFTVLAEFRPNPNGGGGRFVNPQTGQSYNTQSSAWEPVLTLNPITPALTVVPYRSRLPINDPITGSPGGDKFVPMLRESGSIPSWHTPGTFFDLNSANPQGCGVNQICIKGSEQGAFEVSYFHDVRIGGAVQHARIVSCADGGFDCPQTGANTTQMQIDPNQPVGPAACGNGVVRYFAVMPSAPVINARARSRIEVRSVFTPPGGAIGQQLNGRANLQVGLDPIPAWFNGPDSRYTNREISQFANGLANFGAIESLTGGGPSNVDASSDEFSEVNLASPQRNNTNSTRTIQRWQLNLATPSSFESNDLLTANTVSNNDGREVSPAVESLPSADDLDVQTIIDTGKIPLFRFTYGAPPIASATLGADFWLNAAVRYGGFVDSLQEAPNIIFITEPFSEFGLDIFFDFSAIGGLVSASVEASASVYLSNRSEFENGVLDPSTFQCFGFNLDVTFEICALFCASYTENLIEVYKFRPVTEAACGRCVNATNGMVAFPNRSDGSPPPNAPPPPECRNVAQGQPGLLDRSSPVLTGAPPPPRPSLRPRAESSLAYAPDGRGTLIHVDEQNRLVMRSIPFARIDGPGAIMMEQVADTVTSTATAAIGIGGGVALWSYVPGTPGSLEQSTQQQHIKWARTTSNGAQFQPMNLTQPGAGDGNVVVGACPAGVSGCPAGGEATAVWVRRIGASWASHHYALMYAQYRPNTGWTTPARIDPAQGQNSDLLPSVAYRRSNGTPVVFWVRKPTPGLDNPQTRRIAYRFLDGSSPVRIANALPAGVSWPSATSRIVPSGNLAVEELALAYTVNVDPVTIAGRPKAFIGNANALHVARCSFGAAGTCNFVDEQLRDKFGRNLRAEKPTLAADSGGGLFLGFNGLGFGPDTDGNTQRISDPIGMLSGQGDMVVVRPRLDGTPVSVLDLDLGSIGAFKPSFAFNPALDLFDAVSQPLNVGVGVVAKASRDLGLRPLAKGAAGTVSPTVRFASMGAGPDLRVESATPNARRLTPGGSVAVRVTIRNLGRSVTPQAPADLMLSATWDGPAGSAPEAASLVLPAIATDESIVRTINVPVPGAFGADETHALVLTVVAAPAIGEVDGSDNFRSAIFGSMPVPVDLQVEREPGQPMVFLRWALDDPSDDRVVGYRVMAVDDSGNRIPLGSTPVRGFVDLTAVFGQRRQYVITSYSAAGVESAESAVVVAEPAPASLVAEDAVFSNGFESPAP